MDRHRSHRTSLPYPTVTRYRAKSPSRKYMSLSGFRFRKESLPDTNCRDSGSILYRLARQRDACEGLRVAFLARLLPDHQAHARIGLDVARMKCQPAQVEPECAEIVRRSRRRQRDKRCPLAQGSERRHPGGAQESVYDLEEFCVHVEGPGAGDSRRSQHRAAAATPEADKRAWRRRRRRKKILNWDHQLQEAECLASPASASRWPGCGA